MKIPAALVLLTALLGGGAASANTYEPHALYRVTMAMDRTSKLGDDDSWQLFAQSFITAYSKAGASTGDTATLSGNSITLNSSGMRGQTIADMLAANSDPLNPVQYRVVSAEKLPDGSAGNGAADVDEDEPAPAHGNGPADTTEKPVLYAGSKEAREQDKRTAAELDKLAEKHRKSGAPGNGPPTGEGFLGKPVKNTGELDEAEAAATRQAAKPGAVKPAAAWPAAKGTAGTTAPANPGSGSGPPGQLVDPLGKRIMGGTAPATTAQGVWADPKDTQTTRADNERYVYVLKTGFKIPQRMTLGAAKAQNFVPAAASYASLPPYSGR